VSKPAADEPSDPRVEMQRQAQEMAQALMETAELPSKLDWEEFDFKVDPFDPLLDDLEGFIASGKKDNETITSIFQVGMPRHVTLEGRHGVLAELATRMASDVRLDVRQEARLVLRALQQLHVPPMSIGAIWALYPRHLMTCLRERHALFQREQASLTGEDHALVDALVAGKSDADAVKKLGDRGIAVLDRVFRTWTQTPPPSAPLAASLCALAATWPGMRTARGLSLVLWHVTEPSVLAAARAAMAAMRDAARTVLEVDLMLHDPAPSVRREFYPALVALDAPSVLPRMIEDLAGAGPWSEPGKGAAHARPILEQVIGKGDRRAIPMMLLVMSVRPPAADVRSAILGAFAASPMKDEFERGLKAVEAGKPVVVSGNTTQEEFIGRYGQFTDRMKPDKFQAELARVSRLWEECYHESAGWRIPREAAKDVGPREAEMRQALEREVRARMGRLARRGARERVPHRVAHHAAQRRERTHPAGDHPRRAVVANRSARDARGAAATGG
jgi:hypothetical protein